jgi:glucan phosphoethanolaminetransferase (alkaline phosphatase superfamily)
VLKLFEMSRLHKILTVYSTVFITAFAISSPFFLPRPYSLLLTILLVPFVVYFWIGITNPSQVNVGKWSVRLLIVLIILSSLGIGTFWLSKKTIKDQSTTVSEKREIDIPQTMGLQVSSPSSSLESSDLEKNINEIKDDISEIKAMLESKNYSLGISTEETILDQITLKDEVKKADVYENAKTSAKIVGELLPVNNYLFYKKDGDWYQVEYSPDQIGWVKAELVKEVK